MAKKKYTFIDLFAGCGGLSEGFLQTGRFNALAHVEWEKPMVDTLRNRLVDKWGESINESKRKVILFDIQKTDELINGFWSEESNQKYGLHNADDVKKEGLKGLVGNQHVDLIIGGPPCQAYSIHGRATDKDSIQNIGATNGKKILCLYSTGCKYCKRAAIRLDVVRKRYDISDSSFAIVFWGSATKIDSFFVKTNTKVLPHTIVHPIPFLAATKGKQPIIVLLNNGKVEKLLKYPNINEKEIAFFLTTNK